MPLKGIIFPKLIAWKHLFFLHGSIVHIKFLKVCGDLLLKDRCRIEATKRSVACKIPIINSNYTKSVPSQNAKNQRKKNPYKSFHIVRAVISRFCLENSSHQTSETQHKFRPRTNSELFDLNGAKRLCFLGLVVVSILNREQACY